MLRKPTSENDIQSVDENLEGRSLSHSNGTITSRPTLDESKKEDKSVELYSAEQQPSCSYTDVIPSIKGETRISPISSFEHELKLNINNNKLDAEVSLNNSEPELIPRPSPTEKEFPPDIALWPPNPSNEMIEF